MARRKKNRRLLKLLSLAALILTSWLAWELWQIDRAGVGDADLRADCAIVLGAAAWHDKPSPVLEERLNHAIKLYQEERVRKIILTGGFGPGADFSESEVSRRYCLQKGVPPADIFLEKKSRDTLENLIHARHVMEQEKLQNSLLISDRWHLKRAAEMATHLGLRTQPSATRTSRFQSFDSRARFMLTEFILLKYFQLFKASPPSLTF